MHTYQSCSHRPDFASEAEHDRDCPAMEPDFLDLPTGRQGVGTVADDDEESLIFADESDYI